ncbi:MAG: 50S ribosome-binding GTPase [Candidatus Hydrogenedentes bacterium]|nr:50S ribosome-binding GTPase [Candidatus Hydrogenedentota bacterium]
MSNFEGAFDKLRAALGANEGMRDSVFEATQEWSDLLTYKLVPHLAGDGCLVAVVAGGTNTGKSTVFNLLVGEAASPVLNTAAATCHPVIAANERRHAECLESKLVPEFSPKPLENGEGPTNPDLSRDALFVRRVDSLPGHLVVMDTPDVDSIDWRNWEVADYIRAAGDVLIAVVTAEKYKDERVVEFFREALTAGRIVIPLMNKANPDGNFDVARKQLDDFCESVGLEGERFVLHHNFRIADDLGRSIVSLDGDLGLREYLEALDVAAIKKRVFSDTVVYFGEKAGAFLDRADQISRALREVLDDFDNRAHTYSMRYDAVPGAEVGGLFHEFVQSKRGALRRAIGETSSAFARNVGAIRKGVFRAFRRRATLDQSDEEAASATPSAQQDMVGRIAQEMAANYIESARNQVAPLGALLQGSLDALDLEAAVNAIVEQTVHGDSVSDEFRAHANATLESWWEDHKGKRRILEGLDILLAVMPAAIAAPISMYTGGVGAPEAVLALGPFVSQFLTRVMEYQFGDAMFDFLSPWKREQQERLEQALKAHISEPTLHDACGLLEALEGDIMDTLRRSQEECLKA